MPDPKHIKDVRALLKEGKAQEADDMLAILEAADGVSAAAAAAKPAEPPPPRSAYAITLDLLTEIVAHLGNKPSLEQLVEELKAAKD